MNNEKDQRYQQQSQDYQVDRMQTGSPFVQSSDPSFVGQLYNPLVPGGSQGYNPQFQAGPGFSPQFQGPGYNPQFTGAQSYSSSDYTYENRDMNFRPQVPLTDVSKVMYDPFMGPGKNSAPSSPNQSTVYLNNGVTQLEATRPEKKVFPGIEEESRAAKLRRYLCCCIPTRPLHQIICAIVVILVLIGIIVPAVIYYPRFPDIKVLSINLGEINGFNFSLPNGSNNLNAMRIQLDLFMTVSTYNPNKYGLNVDSIDLTAQLMSNTSYIYNRKLTVTLQSFNGLVDAIGPPPTGRENFPNYSPSNSSVIGGSHVGSIYFPAETNVTYGMVFHLDYTPDSVVGLVADPTILELADACGITSNYEPRRPMRIHYKATSSIGALKFVGYSPTIENDIFIYCPVSKDQVNEVVAAVAGGKNALEALQSVLGGNGGN